MFLPYPHVYSTDVMLTQRLNWFNRKLKQLQSGMSYGLVTCQRMVEQMLISFDGGFRPNYKLQKSLSPNNQNIGSTTLVINANCPKSCTLRTFHCQKSVRQKIGSLGDWTIRKLIHVSASNFQLNPDLQQSGPKIGPTSNLVGGAVYMQQVPRKQAAGTYPARFVIQVDCVRCFFEQNLVFVSVAVYFLVIGL